MKLEVAVECLSSFMFEETRIQISKRIFPIFYEFTSTFSEPSDKCQTLYINKINAFLFRIVHNILFTIRLATDIHNLRS